MEKYARKSGKTRIRIIESDSESDFEDGDDLENESISDESDVDKLSTSMKRVQLVDTEGEESVHDTMDRCDLFNDNTRTTPFGRNPSRLEDFSLSSSDESDSSTLHSSEKATNKKQIQERGSLISSKKKESCQSPPLLVDSPMISLCDKKTREPNESPLTTRTITQAHRLFATNAISSADLSLSDSLSSSSLSTSSSSDDEDPFEPEKVHEKKIEKEKKLLVVRPRPSRVHDCRK